jgi:hypothetical protein
MSLRNVLKTIRAHNFFFNLRFGVQQGQILNLNRSENFE